MEAVENPLGPFGGCSGSFADRHQGWNGRVNVLRLPVSCLLTSICARRPTRIGCDVPSVREQNSGRDRLARPGSHPSESGPHNTLRTRLASLSYGVKASCSPVPLCHRLGTSIGAGIVATAPDWLFEALVFCSVNCVNRSGSHYPHSAS